MDIATLATEMKAAAEVTPLDVAKMMDVFFTKGESVNTLQFPDELKRIESVGDFGSVQVQFSHDQLSAGKFLRHLSYKREDLSVPSVEMQEAFRVAFFGDAKNLVPLPSLHGPHVVQLGQVEITNA